VSIANTNEELRSLVKKNGELEISLVPGAVQEPSADEVVVRMEAAPLNPTDIYLLFGLADIKTIQVSSASPYPTITAKIPEHLQRAMAGRVDQSLPVGSEGAGVVVKAGDSAAARELMGKTVALAGGGMYAKYRTIDSARAMLLPNGITPAEGASCFVNPLTALGMVETMRREGHTALVHTAAASNLGQMLNRICIKDGIALVNIVRKPEQAALLRSLGATYVVNSTAPTFTDDLVQALRATGATIAFDATGGGKLAGQILQAMEAVAVAKMTEYSRYGSNTFKQVYLYGNLDRSPTELVRSFGFAWSLSGWLLWPFMQKIGAAAEQRLRARVLAELKTTFASHYRKEISLRDALRPELIASYAKLGTGEKYLINGSLGNA
jgi:NADPH:quinone reductase